MKENLEALHEYLQQMIDLRKAGETSGKWDVLYDLCFAHWSTAVRPTMEELGIDFEYYDPDTTPEADVRALVNALEREVVPAVRAMIEQFETRHLIEITKSIGD